MPESFDYNNGMNITLSEEEKKWLVDLLECEADARDLDDETAKIINDIYQKITGYRYCND